MHDGLHLRRQGDQVALERDLTAVLILREPDAEIARLMAATFLATVRTGIALWLEGAGEQQLPDLVDRLLSRVRVQGT
ncbi:hypothetical protein SK803_03120 [Lentzea sp. BCCO 10_0856]|uniref:MftR C-terminal domain-containing protein n=1 Tax=Lentzea miocenica TaxID=3095431 RepID=A0ABU4STH8_9PSEU|nr:hypothetical protein [Lentzea sp. BCCO 10_0856]MDX8029181.1 hypothetical protein [Lentzea sp. BCCO 10_0856]